MLKLGDPDLSPLPRGKPTYTFQLAFFAGSDFDRGRSSGGSLWEPGMPGPQATRSRNNEYGRWQPEAERWQDLTQAQSTQPPQPSFAMPHPYLGNAGLASQTYSQGLADRHTSANSHYTGSRQEHAGTQVCCLRILSRAMIYIIMHKLGTNANVEASQRLSLCQL